MIELKKLNVNYKNETVFKDFDLGIKSEDFVAIMGASGCGKTTLLNIIAGIITPASGEVIINGEPINKLSLKQRQAYRFENISFIIQSYGLLNEQTVLDNIVVCSKLLKQPIKDTYPQIVEGLGIKRIENKKVNQLSGGQRQRVAIARALYNDNDILLMDEPTGNLDQENAHLIMENIKKINQQQHKTIVLVTHDFSIAKYANKIIDLEKLK